MRLIDADELIAEYTPFIKNAYETNDVLQYTACRNAVFVLKNAPTIDAVPVVHSRWKNFRKQGIAVCMNCSFERNLDDNFGRAISCPNCCARME